MLGTELAFDILARVRGTRDVAKLGDEIDDLGDELDKTSKKTSKTSVETGKLSEQLAEAKSRVRDLLVEFNQTGDSGLWKTIRQEQGNVTRLSKAMKTLGDDAEESGDKTGRGFAGGIVNGLSGLGDKVMGALPFGAGSNPYTAVAAAAGIAAGASFAGAVVSAATLALAGGGTLALGAWALRERRAVVEQVGALKSDLSDLLTDAAAPLERPIVMAVKTIGSAISDVAPMIRGMFSSIAPSVELLARGLAGFATEAMSGFTVAVRASGPVLDEIARQLPEMGEAIGDFFRIVGEHSEGAVAAIKTVATAFNMLTRGTAIAVAFLSDIFAVYAKGVSKLDEATGGLISRWASAGGQASLYSAAISDVVAQASDVTEEQQRAKVAADLMALGFDQATRKAGSLRAALDAINGGAISAAQAQIQFEGALLRVKGAATNSSKSLDVTTEAGQKNRQMLIDGIMAAQNYGSAAGMNAKQLMELRQRYRDAAVAAGFNTAQVDTLIGTLFRVPANKSTTVNANTRPAMNGISGVNRALSSIPEFRTTTLIVRSRIVGAAIAAFEGGSKMHMRAAGGPVRAGMPYLVGEEGPELIVPGASGTVIPNDQLASVGSQGGRAAGGATVTNNYSISVSVAPGANMAEAGRQTVEAIREYERRNGTGWRS